MHATVKVAEKIVIFEYIGDNWFIIDIVVLIRTLNYQSIVVVIVLPSPLESAYLLELPTFNLCIRSSNLYAWLSSQSPAIRPGLRSTVPVGYKKFGALILKIYCIHFLNF